MEEVFGMRHLKRPELNDNHQIKPGILITGFYFDPGYIPCTGLSIFISGKPG